MRRACEIRRAGEWDKAAAIDHVVLDADDRQKRRVVLDGESGLRFLLDLREPAILRDGDGLVLDDGAVVLVSGKDEPLVEISADRPLDSVRLAWHLGNRHTDVQIVGDRLRIRRDYVLEGMLSGLGARLSPLQAPFDPESGTHEDSHGR